LHHAGNRFTKPSNGGLENFAEIEAATFTQGIRAVKVKYGPGGLKIRPIENGLAPGDHFAIGIKEIHGEGF
jgi:hypothetical protein